MNLRLVTNIKNQQTLTRSLIAISIFTSLASENSIVNGQPKSSLVSIPNQAGQNRSAPQHLAQILPNLVPIKIETSPLNSILDPALVPIPNNTSTIAPANAPVSPRLKQNADPRYLISPQALAPQQVDPFSTQFVLNGNRISHFTNTYTAADYEWGNFRTTDLNLNVHQLLAATNTQSVTTDRVLRVNSKIEIGGVHSVAQHHDIAIAVARPQTLVGVRQQISLDANCLDGSGRICSYLPGLKIDDSTIDQQRLQPTGVRITSQFGDPIAPTDVTAIRQAGFQGGATSYGLDLYFPAVGVVPPTNSAPPVLTGSRREDLTTGVAVNYSWMNQDFATNGVESTLGRTIRSINYINGDRNQLLNAAVQAVSQIFPAAQPQIASGKPGAAIVVNPNLFRAANSIRIPDRSLTLYQMGTGYATSRGDDPKIPPGASHQAIWVGLSPVVEREFTRDYYYVTRKAPTIINSGGGEGGNVPVDVNLNNFGFNSGGLQNAYGQGYVTVYNRDVDRYDVDIIRQRTDYYPHLSLTGSSLTENTLWRYYTGAILNIGGQSQPTQAIKAYVGTDYSIVNPRGLSFSVGGIGYLNPDPEYYSHLFANATQTIPLGTSQRHNLAIGFNANYIIDGATTIQSTPVRSTQSSINAGLTANLGDFSIGGTQFFGNLLPDAVDTKTLLNIGWKINNRINIGAFYSPFDRNISTNPYGANLSFTLAPESNAKLYIGWNAAEINFRRTIGSTANLFRDNTFSLSVRNEF